MPHPHPSERLQQTNALQGFTTAFAPAAAPEGDRPRLLADAEAGEDDPEQIVCAELAGDRPEFLLCQAQLLGEELERAELGARDGHMAERLAQRSR